MLSKAAAEKSVFKVAAVEPRINALVNDIFWGGEEHFQTVVVVGDLIHCLYHETFDEGIVGIDGGREW